MKKKISITLDGNILQEVDSIIDNVYIRNRSQAIEHLIYASLGENRTAVILCGGDENCIRLTGGGDFRMTARIGSSTVIEMAVRKLKENGFRTIFIVGRKCVLTSIFGILANGSLHGVNIEYIEEQASKGSADSLKLVKGKINSNFLVVYGDIIFETINISELWNDHLKQNGAATIMLTTSPRPSEKGTVKVEGSRVLQFTQKAQKSDIYLVFSPIFAAGPELLEYPGDSLEYDVFPSLAARQVLSGHLSCEKETHIHSIDDIMGYKA